MKEIDIEIERERESECEKKTQEGNETRIETERSRAREKLIRAFKEPRGCSTAFRTRRRNGLPPRWNGKTNPLSAPSFAFRLCAYITFDPHLCKLSAGCIPRRRCRHRYHRSFANQPPLPLTSISSSTFYIRRVRHLFRSRTWSRQTVEYVRSRRQPSRISFRVRG